MTNPLFIAVNEDGQQVAFDTEEIIAIEPGMVFPVGSGKLQPVWTLRFQGGSSLVIKRYKTDVSIGRFIRMIGRNTT